MTDEKKRLVAKEQTKPCGCHVVEYSDGEVQVTPCPPCGIMEAARHLQLAAQALGASATSMRSVQETRSAMQSIAQGLARGGK